MLAAAATITFVPAGNSRIDRARTDALLAPKGDFDEPKLGEKKIGENVEERIGANEVRNPNLTPDVQAYLLRAYPEKNIPTDASFAAQTGWAALNSESHSGGNWHLIGPSKATFPGVLNALGDGAQVVVAGRVTAMAIALSSERNVQSMSQPQAKSGALEMPCQDSRTDLVSAASHERHGILAHRPERLAAKLKVCRDGRAPCFAIKAA